MSHPHYNIHPRYRISDKYCRFMLMRGGTFTSARVCSARTTKKESGPACGCSDVTDPRRLLHRDGNSLHWMSPHPHIMRRTLSLLERDLGEEKFILIHRSTIVQFACDFRIACARCRGGNAATLERSRRCCRHI
jgi:hypothetical protein